MDLRGLSETTHTLLDPDGAVLGVAFQVPVLDSERPGSFLLTTAHCCLGVQDRVGTIPLRSAAGARRRARVLYRSPDRRACDLALLYVDDWLGEPIPCMAAAVPGSVLVRGSPAGVVTEHANFQGRLAGTEYRGGREFLDVVLSELTHVERPAGREPPLFQTRSLTYEALRGLSGGPICVAGGDGDLSAVGLVLGRNEAGLANRIYGMPIEQAAHELAAHGAKLRLRHRPAAAEARERLVTGLIGRLMGAPGGEGMLWEAVSGLFYSGEPIDQYLQEMVRDPVRYGLTDELQTARTEFLLGRLMLKRDSVDIAVPLLRRARSRLRRAGAGDHEALPALIDLRLLLESGKRSNELRDHRYLVEAAFGRLSEVSAMPEEQRAYELASATGRESLIVCEWRPPPWPPGDEAESYFRMLAARHAALLRDHEFALRDKQEIVQISLSLMSALWNFAPAGGAGRLEQIQHYVDIGQIAARQRSNAIFFCQMLLVEAVLSRDNGRERHAFALACLAADALRKADLLLTHEGVRLITGYLASADPLLHRIVHAVHGLGIRRGVEFVKATHAAELFGSEPALEAAAHATAVLREAHPDLLGVISAREALVDVLDG